MKIINKKIITHKNIIDRRVLFNSHSDLLSFSNSLNKIPHNVEINSQTKIPLDVEFYFVDTDKVFCLLPISSSITEFNLQISYYTRCIIKGLL